MSDGSLDQIRQAMPINIKQSESFGRKHDTAFWPLAETAEPPPPPPKEQAKVPNKNPQRLQRGHGSSSYCETSCPSCVLVGLSFRDLRAVGFSSNTTAVYCQNPSSANASMGHAQPLRMYLPRPCPLPSGSVRRSTAPASISRGRSPRASSRQRTGQLLALTRTYTQSPTQIHCVHQERQRTGSGLRIAGPVPGQEKTNKKASHRSWLYRCMPSSSVMKQQNQQTSNRMR